MRTFSFDPDGEENAEMSRQHQRDVFAAKMQHRADCGEFDDDIESDFCPAKMEEQPEPSFNPKSCFMIATPTQAKASLNFSQIYCLAVDLGLLLGIENLKDRPDAWVCEVDKRWTFAINGSDGDKSVEINGSMGIDRLEKYQMAVWFNGWLAGILNPVGGIICAGTAGNEDVLIKALEERIAVEKLAKEMSEKG